MARPKETTDSPSPSPSSSPVAPESSSEKQYRLYNVSGQTLYVINSDGTHALPPKEHHDLPLSKISHHIKLMARRGFIRLYEKEEKT